MAQQVCCLHSGQWSCSRRPSASVFGRGGSRDPPLLASHFAPAELHSRGLAPALGAPSCSASFGVMCARIAAQRSMRQSFDGSAVLPCTWQCQGCHQHGLPLPPACVCLQASQQLAAASCEHVAPSRARWAQAPPPPPRSHPSQRPSHGSHATASVADSKGEDDNVDPLTSMPFVTLRRLTMSMLQLLYGEGQYSGRYGEEQRRACSQAVEVRWAKLAVCIRIRHGRNKKSTYSTVYCKAMALA